VALQLRLFHPCMVYGYAYSVIGGALSIHIYSLQFGATDDQLRHNEAEAYYVLRGNATIKVG
jgi:mannose-6-phosphate isomerase-like protein (cupin superfamily)